MPSKHSSRGAARSVEAERTGPSIGIGSAALIFFGLSVAYFFPAFLPGRHLFGTDYLAGGYFFYDFVSQRLADGSLPKWVPYIYGGLPLLANPGSTFYPVRLFADYLFPTTWILPFIFLVQFGLAGLGMYLLSRELGSRRWVALLAGLAFQFTGITVSSVYAGHDGRVIVATFAPLLFYFLHRGIRTGRIASFVGAAATVGFSLLSFQIQNNYYLLIAGSIWAVFSLVHLGVYRDRAVLARVVALGLSAVAFGFILTAVNFLPFLDYVSQSPRGAEGGRGYAYSVGFSMPPAELLSVAVPERAGILGNYQGQNPFKLHTEYLGAFVLVLLVLGFRYCRSNRYWWFFGGQGVFALSIALGGYTPIYRIYYELLPGTARFRAPSLSFFLFALSLVAMAAITLERLADARDSVARTSGKKDSDTADRSGDPRRWLIGIVTVVVVASVLAAASAGTEPRDAAMVAGFARFALFTALVCGAIGFWWSGRLKTTAFVVLVALVTVADLWVVGRNFFETVPPPSVTFAPDDVVAFLQNRPEPSRVWVLPAPAQAVYRNHGNYLMLFGIEQAGGEHGNQLQRFNEYAGAGEDVYVDWSNFFGNPNFMNAANIRHIISMVELDTPYLAEVHRGSAIIYENLGALPRAYLSEEVLVTADSMLALGLLAAPEFDVSRTTVVYGASQDDFPDGPLQGSAQIVESTPDRIVIRTEASRPALLVLADNYYPGWQATVNGAETPILRANHTFRGVQVDAGASEVVFEFRPPDVYLGLYIYLVGLVLLAGYAAWLLWARYGSRRSTHANVIS
jgi:hypothetical protein